MSFFCHPLRIRVTRIVTSLDDLTHCKERENFFLFQTKRLKKGERLHFLQVETSERASEREGKKCARKSQFISSAFAFFDRDVTQYLLLSMNRSVEGIHYLDRQTTNRRKQQRMFTCCDWLNKTPFHLIACSAATDDKDATGQEQEKRYLSNVYRPPLLPLSVPIFEREKETFLKFEGSDNLNFEKEVALAKLSQTALIKSKTLESSVRKKRAHLLTCILRFPPGIFSCNAR